ncbi:MAG: hypothetical protein EXR07_01695 [Acetobacteraceae bacterium]|nr:hypothetical protein [Acetobacteraceae bacterium]
MYAHEAFDFLLHGEFPEGRMVVLLKEAEAEISNLPWSPGEEDPNVSSREQVMTLFRHYTLNRPMRPGRDYALCHRTYGLWKWRTRTVRLAGMYFGGNHRFVIAHAGFARGLKRDGKAVKEREAEFAQMAAARLQNLGLLAHSWKIKDPHDGE